jgi:hypothetical protein
MKNAGALGQDRRHLLFLLGRFGQAIALPLAAAATAGVDLFLLPGGRPRRLTVNSDIQAGGLPRRRTRPRARRSRLRMASSICDRSSLNSVRIFDTSIYFFSGPLHLTFGTGFGFYYTLHLDSNNRYFARISALFANVTTPLNDSPSTNGAGEYELLQLTSISTVFPIKIER